MKFREPRGFRYGYIHKNGDKPIFPRHPASPTHSAYPILVRCAVQPWAQQSRQGGHRPVHSNLAPGLLCADGQYRQIVTVEDAVRAAAVTCSTLTSCAWSNKFPDEYQNLLMCEFVDDPQSVFPLSELQACMVDSWEVWTDFSCSGPAPVWLARSVTGYDPAKQYAERRQRRMRVGGTASRAVKW